jgi:hypothetical protein
LASNAASFTNQSCDVLILLSSVPFHQKPGKSSVTTVAMSQALAKGLRRYTTKTATFSGSEGENKIPNFEAQFFYSSPVSIDDPLFPVPPPANSETKAANYPMLPFSVHDNEALEAAWNSLASEEDRKNHNKGYISRSGGRRLAERRAFTLDLPSVEQAKKKATEKRKTTFSVNTQHDQSTAELEHTIGPKGNYYVSSSSQRDSQLQESALKGTRAKASEGSGTSHSTSNKVDDGHVLRGSTREVVGDHGARDKSEFENNATETSCEDRHHTPLCTSVPTCCSEMERGSQPDHKSCVVEGHQEKGEEHQEQVLEQQPENQENARHKSRAELAEPELDIGRSFGDATDETYLKRVVGQSKAPGDSQNSQKNLNADLDDSEAHGNVSKVAKNNQESKSCPDQEECCRVDDGISHSLQTCANETQAHQFKAKVERSKTSSGSTQPPESELGDKSKSLSKENQRIAASQPSDPTNFLSHASSAGTSGSPFLKLPFQKGNSQAQSTRNSSHDEPQLPLDDSSDDPLENARRTHERDSTETEILQDHGCRASKHARKDLDVLVGISRLHLVKLPALQMKPIYWSPVHDVYAVTRGTWFYKNTMYPVEPAVANQLEMGYRYLQPWSQTWHDQLDSAIEVGAAGEEKISHLLWPKEEDQDEGSQMLTSIVSVDPHCAARCFKGEAAAEGSTDPESSGTSSSPKTISKKYPHCQVIYKDSRNAFILKPNLQPSEYYGRKPLQKIMKGTIVGLHVVRGFDWDSWEKLHPSKKTRPVTKMEANPPATRDVEPSKRDKNRAQELPITDLCLVIHGIGQKLSLRHESFNFSHAMNGVRRLVNAELRNQAVRSICRPDFGGVMVLPVNWRSDLSFEDSELAKDGDGDQTKSLFSTKDITPGTIPKLRTLISDVMYDIPFYMSDHKPKMIQACIREANRVYQLWCKHNPGFHQGGRVHIIAHSLGSAMALEILSKQPNYVPDILQGNKIGSKYFAFNTRNLFFAGSPAGFFLLLERANLIPRIGWHKSGEDGRHVDDRTIGGDAGTFGCLAVDNLYNVMDYNDPIAYRLNPTVDPQYATSLKEAKLPSTNAGFFANAMKYIPGISAPVDHKVDQLPKPATIGRLPSQVEMAVHDFNREQMAEKKFHRLNDNGQVDWFMGSRDTPLDTVYLNVVGAHSGYWQSPEFIRLVVTEICRQPGKNHTMANLRAVKNGPKP